MARVQVTLDIEERDLRLFQNAMGVCMPTRVIRLVEACPGVFRLQHGERLEGEALAIPYTRGEGVKYPPTELAFAPLPADYQQLED